jgi:hypothetical protein
MKAGCLSAKRSILAATLLSCFTVIYGAEHDAPPSVEPGSVRVAGIVLKWLRGDKEANYAAYCAAHS